MSESVAKCLNNNNTYPNKTKQRSDCSHRHKYVCYESDCLSLLPNVKYLWASFVVVTMATICYGNSYDAQFVFDDSEAIIGNKDLKPDTPLIDLFYHDFWGTKLTSNTSHKSYRPLTVLTFRLNSYFAGGLHPAGFHITNLVLHGLVCVLLLPVFTRLLGSSTHQGCVQGMPLLCTVLFTVHPVHTESVAGIVGRADLLCATTFLLSFLAFDRALTGNKNKIGFFECDMRYLVLSMGLCVISTFCKEIGITVLGICVLYDVIMISQINPLDVILMRQSDQSRSRSCPVSRPLMFRVCVLVVTGVGILLVRWRIQGSTSPVFQVVDNPHSFVNDTLLRILNYNYLYSLNAWLLLNPWWLCFDWSLGCVPVIESLTDVRLLAVGVFWFVLGSLIGSCLRGTTSKEQRCLMMSLACMIVPFLPASNVVFRVGFVIAERVLYLPSIGFVMLVALGLRRLAALSQNKLILQVFISLLLLCFGMRSYRRSLDWHTEEQLFLSGEHVCPLNAKVHYNIAKIYGDKGNISFAIAKYRHAISLHPEYDQAMNNLANILKEQGDLLEAEELLIKATSIRPEFAAAWMNLAIVQASLNKTELAERHYYTALSHRRKYPDCYYNLGNLYVGEKRYTEALSAWMNATLIKPTHASAWYNMIILLDNLGRLSDIDAAVKEAQRHLPNDAGIYYNYANALGKAGKFQEAEQYFLKAIALDSSVPSYYSNLAVLYHRWGKLEKANELYLKALQLDPHSEQIQTNYALLLKKMKKIT